MKILLLSITLVSAVLMIIVILLQQGKGAELGSAFGGGARGGLFTSTGKANFLTRTTSLLVSIFLISALFLSIFLSNTKTDGVLEELESSGGINALETLDEDNAPDDVLVTEEEESAGDEPVNSEANDANDAPDEETEAEIKSDTESVPATEETPN